MANPVGLVVEPVVLNRLGIFPESATAVLAEWQRRLGDLMEDQRLPETGEWASEAPAKHRSRPASRKSMQRDPRAYLNDILEAVAASIAAAAGVDRESYGSNRLIRSAVEREFIIIGEALRVISQRAPELFERIPEGRQIIDFCNLLTHDYLSVSDRIVWGAIQSDLPLLVQHCAQLLHLLNQEVS